MGIVSFLSEARKQAAKTPQQQFEELIQPHLQQLYRLAYRLTGQREAAEDLVQDIVVKLYPRLDELRRIERLSSWLSRVLYRHFVDQYRARQRSPVDLQDEGVDEQQLEAEARPEATAENRLLRRDLLHALGQLNEDQRLLVLLHDVEGYTLKEIHEMQQVPLGTMKSRLNRARTRLRELLQQREPFAPLQRVNE